MPTLAPPANEDAKLKGYKEDRESIRQEISSAKAECQRALDSKLSEMNADEPNQAKIEVYSDMADKAEARVQELEAKEAQFTEVIDRYEAMFPTLDVEFGDEGDSPEDEDENLELDEEPSFSTGKRKSTAPDISEFKWRDGNSFEGVRRYQSGLKFKVPSDKDADGELSADVLAHPQYEVLVNDYIRYRNRTDGMPDSFARYFADNKHNYSGIEGASVTIPLLPMRIINDLECRCNANLFMRSLGTVHNVTEACSLEIWKRGPRVSSYHRGCVCKHVPKSKLPDRHNAKILTPQQWTQGAEVCRRKLRCKVINPVDQLLSDMTEERIECQEFEYLYGSGVGGPLGIWTDTEVPDQMLKKEDFDENGDLKDPAKVLLRAYKEYPQRCRRSGDNVWIFTDWMFCQVLSKATYGDGCCHNGLTIDEGPGLDGALTTYLSAPGVPRRPVYVIDDELRNADFIAGLDEDDNPVYRPKLPKDHMARDILFSFGSLRDFHIAEFPLGTGLESQTDIRDDSICWIIRGFDDALLTCPQKLMRWRKPGPTGAMAQKLAQIAKEYAPQA